jgi:hypothetical protein
LQFANFVFIAGTVKQSVEREMTCLANLFPAFPGASLIVAAFRTSRRSLSRSQSTYGGLYSKKLQCGRMGIDAHGACMPALCPLMRIPVSSVPHAWHIHAGSSQI